MADYKYNHFVFQSYLKNWEDVKKHNHIWLYNKKNMCFSDRPAKNVLGKDYLYSMDYSLYYPFLPEKPLTAEDLSTIFEPLDQYYVVYEGHELTTSELLAVNFPNYDKWKISYNNGLELPIKTKNHIKSLILTKKIPSVEKYLGTIENNWQVVVQKIIDFSRAFINQDNDLCQKLIDSFDLEDLYNYIVLQFIRTPKYLGIIERLSTEIFEISILKEFPPDKLIPSTPAKTIFIRDLKNRNKSVLSKIFNQICAEIIIEDGPQFFYTSDNPVTLLKANNNEYSLFMPITPKIVVFINNNQSKKLLLRKNLPTSKVEEINSLIIDNACEVFISNQEIKIPGFVRKN